MTDIKKGDSVAWQWGNGLAEGTVKEVHTSRVEIESKGKKVVRNGTADNPAIIINHKSGNPVLKLQSEVQQTNK
jgi:hypothetical protein